MNLWQPLGVLWDVFDAKFKSNARAAAALHVQWKRLAAKDARGVSTASLATKIGDLRRGKSDWWSRRLPLARLFAEMIERDVEALLERSLVPTGALRFPEFPGLPPLLPDEEPCRIDREGWLRGWVLDGIERDAQAWIIAGPGMGKSFVVRWLQAHAEHDCVASSVRTLVGATEMFGDAKPLVLDVDEPDPRTDADALRVLGQRSGATIILAPFSLPVAPRSRARRTTREPEWEERPILFSPHARERLLRWIDERLEMGDGDTRLELDAVLQLLRSEDPQAQRIATPGDLLAFCADVHAFGTDAASWETRARRWLGSIGPTQLPSDAPPTWARHLERTCDALCVGAITRREHAWGPLAASAWSELLPDDLRGPRHDRLGGHLIVGYLREAGLLRGAEGGLALSPTWVRHGLAIASLDRAIETDEPDVWGLLAADRSRQGLVDAALDRRTDTAFCATVRAVALAKPRRSLGRVAAHEAVFAAAARRLARGNFTVPRPDLDAWHRLVELQIGSLKVDGDVVYPFSRHDEDDFWADTWTMSLKLPRPSTFARPELMWRFPGWFPELDAARLPRSWPWSSVSPLRAGRAVRQMIVQALAVLPKLRELPADTSLARVLLPAAVLLAPAKGWTLTASTLNPLPGSWEARALVRLAEARPAEERADIAALLWDRLPFLYAPQDERAPVTLRLARLKNVAPDLLPFIVENLSETALTRTIDSDGVQRHTEETEDLLLLPRPLRRLVVQAVLADQPGRLPAWFTARAMARVVDAEDLELIIDVLRESDANVAAEFTEFVWQTDPSRARDEATRALVEGRPSAHAWFSHAPRLELTGLVDLLQRAPRPLPEWVPRWAEWRIFDAGPVAEALFALTEREPSS